MNKNSLIQFDDWTSIKLNWYAFDRLVIEEEKDFIFALNIFEHRTFFS